MKKSILALLLFVGFGANAQLDPIYNQYLMNQSAINPAYIGMYHMGMASALSRGQWIGIDGAPFTNLVNASSTITEHSAVGFSFVNETFGINSTNDLKLSYAYRIDMYGKILSFGLTGGWSFYKQDFNKLDTETTDPSVGTGTYTYGAPNFGFGVMYRGENYYLGFAAPRLQSTDISQAGSDVTSYKQSFNLSAGFLITPLSFFKIKPSTLIRYQNEEWAIDLNGQVLVHEKIWLGLMTRNFSSAGVNFIYQESGIYHFGYAFEFPFGDIGKGHYGTHELFLSIDLKIKKDHKLDERFF